MRCQHCAGEIVQGSRFCGICGRPTAAAPAATSPPVARSPDDSPSLFELPVSRRARLTRMFAVLALDLILLGAGVAMILSYLDKRERARGRGPGSALSTTAALAITDVGTTATWAAAPDPDNRQTVSGKVVTISSSGRARA